jgi:hypothetical protein
MADASATASIEMRDEDASGDHESRWQAATKRIIFGRRVVETITMHSVESHVKKKRLVHSVSSVNVPSSDHGPHPLVPVRMGIHGDTTGRDYEAPDANFGATMHRVCRKRLGCMSAAELGRTCAKIDASSRRVIKAPWEDPALSAGGSSVFDPRLGGGGVFMKRGESRSFRPGDKVACQHSNASNNQHWHGRLGYRAVSALETYRSDPLSSKLSGACGPWMLMTMKPRFTRNREQLARSIPQLARTTQRPQSRETWEKYEPGVIFGSFRRFKSFSVHFSDPSNDAKAAVSLREDDASVSLNLVKLNRMWKELIVDPVGRIWYRLQVETQAFVTQRDKYQASLAKAEKKKIEEDNRKIEVLMERAALEKQEAEEALERVEKERAEFEKSWKRFEKEKEQFEQAVREAEEDDAVDDEETERIAKEKMEMGIAEARMNKEMAEFHGWEAKAQKEIEEYEVIKARCDQRIAEQQAWLQEANARSMDRALMQFNQTYPSLSVLARLNAARLPDDHVEVEVYLGNSLEMEKNTDEQTGIEYAFVQNSDFVNYEGQWLNGQPTVRQPFAHLHYTL